MRRVNPSPQSSTMLLYGRDSEQATLATLIRQVCAGHGRVIIVSGDPGIGKTALLEKCAEVASEMRILRVQCVESESELEFFTLYHLLTPVLDFIDRLPGPQSGALRAAFDPSSGSPPDRFLVSLATLSILTELALDTPLLLIVDDAHWMDQGSADVLIFVARRLEATPIALLLATHSDDRDWLTNSCAVAMPLRGLDRPSARQLLVARFGNKLTAAQQNCVLDATAGNPLAIRELSVEDIKPEIMVEPLPVAERLIRAFLRRVRSNDEPLQRLLLLVASDDRIRWDVLRSAAATLGPAMISSLERFDLLDDLINDDGATIVFRHPLIRAAIYHGATPTDRRDAHRALASAIAREGGGSARRAWHLGQAVEGCDDSIAEELEQAAHDAGRSSTATAATLLTRAVELSTPGLRRSRRQFIAALAWWRSGYFGRALALLDGIDVDNAQDETLHVQITVLRASLELQVGRPADALEMLRPIVGQAMDTGTTQAIPVLILLGEASTCADEVDAYCAIEDAANRLLTTGGSIGAVLGRLLRGAYRVRKGKNAEVLATDLDAADQLTNPGLLCWASEVMWWLGERDKGRHLSRLSVQLSRSLGDAVYLTWALARVVSDDLSSGRFDSSATLAEEGRDIADGTGQINASLSFRAALASVAALRGDQTRAQTLAREVLDDALPRGMMSAVIIARRALGLLDLAAGRPDEALAQFRTVDDGTYLGPAIANVPELIEAAVQTRQPDLAAEPLRLYTRWADATNGPELRALAARCRALVASPAVADREFSHALELHQIGNQPLETARTHLLYGQHLRRQRRQSEARAPLRAAYQTFRALGATGWAERARHELRAAGEGTRLHISHRPVRLTEQEREIVNAVADGLTNRDIAAQMFLSPRTIDYHLRKIYKKIGVSSRAELIHIILDDGSNE